MADTALPGPYVQTAAFVETVLNERDGVLSLIRLIDRIFVNVPAGAPPELPEGGNLTVRLAIMLKAGDARGRHQVSLHPHLPSGQDLESKVVEVFFEGDERGVNLIIDLELPGMEGLYWVDVDVSGRVITRMPLRLIYQRLPN